MDPELCSPLKSIQGAAIQDLTSGGGFAPRSIRRQSLPPPKRNPDWVLVPRGTLLPKASDNILTSVLVTSKLIYKPAGPRKHQSSSSQNSSDKWRKVIISRQLLTNGHVSFVVGTKFGGVITRCPDEVPLSKVLNHVTPAELLRYENQEYLLEEIREENLPPSKPRGRPRKLQGTKSSESPREQSTVPIVRRPRQVAVVIPVTPHSPDRVDTNVSTASKLHRVYVPVPFINRSQPVTNVNSTSKNPPPEDSLAAVKPAAELPSSGDRLGAQKHSRPQYSMVTASGIAPSDDEISTDVPVSRAESYDPISPEGQPTHKRRKLTPSSHSHSSHDDADRPGQRISVAMDRPQDGSKPESIEPVDALDVRDEEDEREALLRQFQPSNLARRHISLDASSRTPTSPKESRSPVPLTTERSTPRKVASLRLSITPHFPPAVRFTSSMVKQMSPTKENSFRSANESKSIPSSKPKNPPKSNPRGRPRKHPPAPHEISATTHRRNLPILSHNSLKSHSKTPAAASKNPRPTRLQDLGPTADISNYFRPKSSTKPPPAATQESDSESEDPLARVSSSDSLQSKNIVVQQRSEAGKIPPIYEISDDNESVHSEFPTIQRRQGVGRKNGGKRHSSEVPDSDDEHGLSRPVKRTMPIRPNGSLSKMFHDSVMRDMDERRR